MKINPQPRPQATPRSRPTGPSSAINSGLNFQHGIGYMRVSARERNAELKP
jgi:hypothetical protein